MCPPNPRRPERGFDSRWGHQLVHCFQSDLLAVSDTAGFPVSPEHVGSYMGGCYSAIVTPPVPATVGIPSGRLEIRDANQSIRVMEILPFRIGRTPVTNSEYAPFLAARAGPDPPPWWDDPNFCSPEQPVVGVTWNEAMAYCAWIASLAGGRWRLPTQFEWEFAMRGGLLRAATSWGDDIPLGEIPRGPLMGPWKVGRGTPNGYGVFDPGTMVHEWCSDWHEPEGPHRPDAPPRRASRGGSWRHRIRWSPPHVQSSLPPGYRYSDYGFRVVSEEAL